MINPLSDATAAMRYLRLDHADLGVIDGSDAFTVDDVLVVDTRRRLDQAGIVDQIEQWSRSDRKGEGGRPETFSKRSLLVAMFLTARLGKPMLVTEWMKVIGAMTSEARATLGLEEPPSPSEPKAQRAYYRRLRYRFHAIEALLDSSLYPKNRRLSDDEMARRLRQLTAGRIAELEERQLWFINRVLRISLRAVPRELWRSWRGGLAVDATVVGTFARHSRTKETKGSRRSKGKVLTWSADPDAAWYIREGDHGDAGDSSLTKSLWGYEQTLAIIGPAELAMRGRLPSIIAGMARPHIPGASPGRNGFAAVNEAADAVRSLGALVGPVAGDNAYVNAMADDFAIPLRDLGLWPVFDYNESQLGLQGEHEGAHLVEGRWYCPAMPAALVSATIDYRAKRIDQATYDARIRERMAFEFRPKERPRPGLPQRLLCPAAAGAPTARCDHKPASLARRHLVNPRVDLNHLLKTHPPKACRQQTITIPVEASGRFEQPLRLGTEEWRFAYQTLRSADEGAHGLLKDGRYQSIEDPSRRRLRGQAANALITCFMICANNLALLGRWLETAEVDERGILRRQHPSADRRARPAPEETLALATSGNDPP